MVPRLRQLNIVLENLILPLPLLQSFLMSAKSFKAKLFTSGHYLCVSLFLMPASRGSDLICKSLTWSQ